MRTNAVDFFFDRENLIKFHLCVRFAFPCLPELIGLKFIDRNVLVSIFTGTMLLGGLLNNRDTLIIRHSCLFEVNNRRVRLSVMYQKTCEFTLLLLLTPNFDNTFQTIYIL